MDVITSIKKNFFYNAFYQILVLILPFVTAPYISRIMGAEKIGVYSYSYSIATYFGLFILLGVSNYGNRTIAAIREDKAKLSNAFWSIFIMQVFMACIVVLIYLIYVFFFAYDKTIALIQFIYLLSVALDINWFYFGLEKFKITVTRNTIIKILTVICVFIFVNKKDDIIIYAFIMSMGSLISQIALWFFLKRYIVICKIHIKEVKKHIIPNLVLFIPVIAISLYTIMDKIMLGYMSDMIEVGYYENANKLTQIPTMAVTSLGTVMLPRMSNLIAKGDHKKAMVYIRKSLLFSMILSCPIAFGLSGIVKEFVPFFYGIGFEKCELIIPIIILSSVFISWANVIRTQYLIPNKKDTIYIKSVFLGAVVNVVINIVLIPLYKSVGAAIGTLFAEISVSLYQSYKIKNEINILKYFSDSIPIVICSIIMYITLVNMRLETSLFISLLVKIVCGVFVFMTSFCVYLLLRKLYKSIRRKNYDE